MSERSEAYVQMLRDMPWGEQDQSVWDDYWSKRMALERALGMRNADGERVRARYDGYDFKPDDEEGGSEPAQMSLFEVCG